MSLIVCNQIRLAYDKTVVLSDLSFSVERGDYLCIVGENGSGKSTLVKALLGLHRTDAGTITLGEGLSRCEIAYLPQQSAVQKDFPADVGEVVLSGLLSRKGLFSFYTAKDRAAAKAVMARLGILDYAAASFRELSGGQQQRVLLARALVSKPTLLLVDEPTTGLDPMVTADFYRLIEEISHEGVTVVMVTHDMEAAMKYATHILHLQNKPLFFGTREDYLKSEIGNRYTGEHHA